MTSIVNQPGQEPRDLTAHGQAEDPHSMLIACWEQLS